MNLIGKELENIASIGVISSIGLIYPEKNTELEGMKMPSSELLKAINCKNVECIINNKLNPLEVVAGYPRNGAYSPVKEYYEDYMNVM